MNPSSLIRIVFDPLSDEKDHEESYALVPLVKDNPISQKNHNHSFLMDHYSYIHHKP